MVKSIYVWLFGLDYAENLAFRFSNCMLSARVCSVIHTDLAQLVYR